MKNNKNLDMYFFMITIVTIVTVFYICVNSQLCQDTPTALTTQEELSEEIKIIYCLSDEARSRIGNLEREVAMLEKENEMLIEEINAINNALDIDGAFSDEEWEMLYRIVRSEAGSWSEEGQKNVAKVVFNRIASEKFPDTVKEVVFQKSQFSVVSNGSYYKVEITDFTKDNVKEAYEEWLEGDTLDNALFFCSGSIEFKRHKLFIDEVGHKFYR